MVKEYRKYLEHVYEKRIAHRLSHGMTVCLPCYMIRKPYWELAKKTFNEITPKEYVVDWAEKRGTLIFKNK